MNIITSAIAFFKGQSSEADKVLKAKTDKEEKRVKTLDDVATNAKSTNDLISALAQLAKNEKKADEQKANENKIRAVFGIPAEY